MKPEYLDVLEEKATRIIEVAQKLRMENQQLREKNSRLVTEIGNLQRENKQISEKVIQGEKERAVPLVQPVKVEELKTRIKNILTKLENK